MEKSKSMVLRALAAIMLTVTASQAWSAVSAEEAASLKTTLTPLGAEKAGNKEGTIPAWEGGYTKVPAGYKAGQPRPDFFADEKPLYSVSAKNMEQYADKLSETTKAMLKKYPDYRLDVYPTHRTASAPQWVYDNTFKNATRAKLTNGGDGFEGAYGGIPFPIPKDGNEIAWNHRNAWAGSASEATLTAWITTAQGKHILASKFEQWFDTPYYEKDGSLSTFGATASRGKIFTSEPSSKNGEAVLSWTEANGDFTTWQYLVGQRRVRRAPSFTHDSPNFVSSGIGLTDETFGIFGPLNRHNLKIVGKREMLIPYNNNKAAAATIEQILKPNFLNPDLIRWELHRVWVVEATLKEGKRHVVPKRMYYFDEDTWAVSLMDGWDAKGNLWRGYFSLTLLAPDVPALVGTMVNWGGYNVQTGEYYVSSSTYSSPKQFVVTPRRPSAFFESESLNEGAR